MRCVGEPLKRNVGRAQVIKEVAGVQCNLIIACGFLFSGPNNIGAYDDVDGPGPHELSSLAARPKVGAIR